MEIRGTAVFGTSDGIHCSTSCCHLKASTVQEIMAWVKINLPAIFFTWIDVECGKSRLFTWKCNQLLLTNKMCCCETGLCFSLSSFLSLSLSQRHTETHSLSFTDSRCKPQVCECVYVGVSLCVSELLGNSFLFWSLCSFDCNFTTPYLKQLELFHLRSLGHSLYAGTINLRHADEKQQNIASSM